MSRANQMKEMAAAAAFAVAHGLLQMHPDEAAAELLKLSRVTVAMDGGKTEATDKTKALVFHAMTGLCPYFSDAVNARLAILETEGSAK